MHLSQPIHNAYECLHILDCCISKYITEQNMILKQNFPSHVPYTTENNY